MLLPCRFASDFSRSRHNTAWARHGMCEQTSALFSAAFGRSAQVRFLPTTTRSFTIGSSDLSGYMLTFTKNTALSKDGRSTAWPTRINLNSSAIDDYFPGAAFETRASYAYC